jgi:ABC-2 type transport system ATP-binding protein
MSLIVENIDVGYSNETIIESLSLKCEKGKALGIAGINGAGKSTTLKTISGLLPYKKGKLTINGFTPKNYMDKEIIKAKIGYCPDVGGVIPAATPVEHINILMNLYPKKDRARIKEKAEYLLKLVQLDEKKYVPCGDFSHGMLRRMSVVLASLNAKEVLILDEPFDGVDPTGIKAIKTIIDMHKEEGVIVIISSHLIDVLSSVTDEIIVMQKGKIAAQRPSHEFSGELGRMEYAKILGI